jgi:hypothetical protein
MASSAWSCLYTLAALSVTFVGFSSLVVVLRQTMGGEMSQLDVLITRTFIQVGFLVAAGAMLPLRCRSSRWLNLPSGGYPAL